MSLYLVTGAAGFIGYHLAERLIARGDQVVGLDNMNNYYDVRLKEARLDRLKKHKGFSFVKTDLADTERMQRLFSDNKFTTVINLAAQAGVRFSLVNPHAYVSSNILGFLNVLEGCRRSGVQHLVFASSSSVYGANTQMPFSVHHNVDHPVSIYAATKKANELMAHSYAHLYRLPCTGLRFFTVYGPWGRPDMALFLFTKSILEGKPIDVFNNGHHQRDFTYIDDIVEGVVRVSDNTPKPNTRWSGDSPDPSSSSAPYKLYNIGNHKPVQLLQFIEILEKTLGRSAIKNMLPMQAGDVPSTYADVDDLARDIDFAPATPIEEGIEKFVEWYCDFYKLDRRSSAYNVSSSVGEEI